MHVLITGGGGFLGTSLAKELLENGGLVQGDISKLTLLDKAFPRGRTQDSRLEYVEADFGANKVISDLIKKRPQLIFHLAAIVSGEAEKNFELGMHINFQASMQLLELCRSISHCPRLIFASSCAVFGGDVTKVIIDETASRPLSSYGTQKAIIDLLLNDYSRRGLVDARSLRLPTIAIRPGKPNAATSSFVSAIIREPLNGEKATYPVPIKTPVWIQSPKRVIQNFIHAANINETELGGDRIINLPGLTVTIQDMIQSLQSINPGVAELISYEPDAFLQSIVLTWPPNFDTEKALSLGFVRDESAEEIIQSYIEQDQMNS
jgi:nucleoside-diphosphate-sugar epimerase